MNWVFPSNPVVVVIAVVVVAGFTSTIKAHAWIDHLELAILDRIKWEIKPPSPHFNDQFVRKPKRAFFFFHHWNGGRGDSNFSFGLTEIVAITVKVLNLSYVKCHLRRLSTRPAEVNSRFLNSRKKTCKLAKPKYRMLKRNRAKKD